MVILVISGLVAMPALAEEKSAGSSGSSAGRCGSLTGSYSQELLRAGDTVAFMFGGKNPFSGLMKGIPMGQGQALRFDLDLMEGGWMNGNDYATSINDINAGGTIGTSGETQPDCGNCCGIRPRDFPPQPEGECPYPCGSGAQMCPCGSCSNCPVAYYVEYNCYSTTFRVENCDACPTTGGCNCQSSTRYDYCIAEQKSKKICAIMVINQEEPLSIEKARRRQRCGCLSEECNFCSANEDSCNPTGNNENFFLLDVEHSVLCVLQPCLPCS